MWSGIKSLLGLGGEPDSPEVVQAKQWMAADAVDARKHFVWCVLSISVNMKADPGYLPEMSSVAIRDWYGTKSREQLLPKIERFLEGTGSTPGYDAFRVAFMGRAGLGAGMLSEEESWETAFRAARKVKRSYPSWNHYGMSFIQGHLDYRQKQGDSEEQLAQHKRNVLEHMRVVANKVWPKTPFETQV